VSLFGNAFEDVQDHFGLGVGVRQAVVGPRCRGVEFRLGVAGARLGVGSKVVTKTQVFSLPVRAGLANVDVDVA
jgi:hypothetical protein